MKFGIRNNDLIIVQAKSKHLRIYEQLELLKRGKRETPIKTTVNRGGEYKNVSKFLYSRESRDIVPRKPTKVGGGIVPRLVL
jgi:hypothetical protein